MTVERARSWLTALRNVYRDDVKVLAHDRDGGTIIDALDIALDAVAPPTGAGHCEWIYLPDADLTPYEHIGITANMINDIDGYLNHADRRPGFTINDMRIILMALKVYKSVLLTVNADRILEVMESRKGLINE